LAIADNKLDTINITHNPQSKANQKNMLAISQELPRMSIKEYLEWEPQQDIRYEYNNGEIYAMTGGTLAHNDITLNLYRTLYPHVRSRGCRINVSDVKVQVSTNSPYY